MPLGTSTYPSMPERAEQQLWHLALTSKAAKSAALLISAEGWIERGLEEAKSGFEPAWRERELWLIGVYGLIADGSTI